MKASPPIRMSSPDQTLKELSERNRDVFQALVEMYLENGSPVGSRTLSRDMDRRLSSATIRNTMQDLEFLGLLESPHVSSGRIPTERGLRLFVDELLEVNQVEDVERDLIESVAHESTETVEAQLERVGSVLSRLTNGASLVLTPKTEAPVKHVEFVALGDGRALVVLVTEDGKVENRVFVPPAGQTPSSMREAANFVNAVAKGRTIADLRKVVGNEIRNRKQEIDRLAGELVERGLAVWDTAHARHERLIVRGRANLLGDEEGLRDMDRIRELFDDLERKRDIADFLEYVEDGEGVRIFIGSENRLFSLTGSTLVISPYMNTDQRIVGAVGVIGPTRLNYGRIVPIVDCTAQLIGRIVSEKIE